MTVPTFTGPQLESICRVLGDTTEGLTGSEIARLLAEVRVKDIDPQSTKWQRLFNALAQRQNSDRSGDRVLAFISTAMNPSRYTQSVATFDRRREDLNVSLALCGLEFGEDGKFHRRNRARTLSEAAQRANRLRTLLEQRQVHTEVLRFCSEELLKDNYFHAVLEATKSVAAKIRIKSGLQSDGSTLVDEAFGGSDPILSVNGFVSEAEKGEQRGFVNLLKGMFGTFRNPAAHAPRIEWPMSEQDALDLMSLASYAFRRIDAANRRR